ncbi:hypothetical protein HAX54_004973 [Datura stramonium]|uniref:Uncharacterized protein n=1 Tax=Datura stramonium TaxID=4076 RepID=A0ABS8T8Y6_DATST|nr:hypothetical protein [Datura stramonium]
MRGVDNLMKVSSLHYGYEFLYGGDEKIEGRTKLDQGCGKKWKEWEIPILDIVAELSTIDIQIGFSIVSLLEDTTPPRDTRKLPREDDDDTDQEGLGDDIHQISSMLTCQDFTTYWYFF